MLFKQLPKKECHASHRNLKSFLLIEFTIYKSDKTLCLHLLYPCTSLSSAKQKYTLYNSDLGRRTPSPSKVSICSFPIHVNRQVKAASNLVSFTNETKATSNNLLIK